MKKGDILICDYWEKFISTKSVGTAASYNNAIKRFIKDMGSCLTFKEVSKGLISEWREKMKSELNKTSANIYLRAFSALLHVAYDDKIIRTAPKQLFKGMRIYGRNASLSRKHEYLPVSEWQKIWNFFETKGTKYKSFRALRKEHKENLLETAGVLLFMYLANGMNLRDVCALRYDTYYYATGRKALRFIRHKTADRTSQNVEFPILPELRIIIDRLGSQERKGGLVFPYFKDVEGNEYEEHRIAAIRNHYIAKRMRLVSKIIELPCVPTSTWARHSFATNLIQSDIPKDYVAWAMGHVDYDITSNYIEAAHAAHMWKNNKLLLHPKTERDEIIEKLSCLSPELLNAIAQLIVSKSEK